ncbi:ATP-binding cassette domain-containing protein, partial [Shewanella algae]|uniref:ATP-binding cassette domain-containing protein n=1 Tax=Shewanella algae TaxID=38313 RepID=UPI00313D85B5
AARGAAARIVDLAEAPPPVPEPASPAPLPDKTGIRFDNVSFRWTDAAPDVLSHLTLEIPAGAKVAILGASGAGKSTLAALLLKIAAPRSG